MPYLRHLRNRQPGPLLLQKADDLLLAEPALAPRPSPRDGLPPQNEDTSRGKVNAAFAGNSLPALALALS